MPPRVSLAAAALAVLVTTACGAGDELRGAMSTTDAPAPAATPTAPPAADPSAPAVPCTGSMLSVSLGPTSVSGDSVSQDLIFQNVGPGPCLLRGFPSVVAVAGNAGTPVGDPALPLGERGPEVRLEPRGAAVAPLRLRDPASFDDDVCRPRPVRGLRVVPAGGTGAVFVPREAVACSTTPPDEPQSRVRTTVRR